jgi:hypothetical protein
MPGGIGQERSQSWADALYTRSRLRKGFAGTYPPPDHGYAYDLIVTNAKVLVAVLTIVLAGCSSGSPAESTAPSSSAGASASASASATESASANESVAPSSGPPGPVETIARSTTDGILPPGSIGIAMVDNLRVRDAPSLSGKILISLDKWSRVDVSSNPTSLGPVTADGYDWYPVLYQSYTGETFGWAAAGAPATPFLATLKPRCGGPGTLILTEHEQLACHGSGSVTIEGTYGCGGCGGFAAGTFEPSWLANPIDGSYTLRAKPGQGIGQIDMHKAPDAGIELPAEGAILRVTGHFDDDAASTCFIAPLVGEVPSPADERATLLYCRERFVIDSFEQIGTDPAFPN